VSPQSRHRTTTAPSPTDTDAPVRADERIAAPRGADCSRREQIRDLVRLETALADRLAESVTDPALRKRIAAASINVGAIEAFFLNHPRARSAEDERLWLEAAEHWLAIHVSALRGLEYEAEVLGFL
jgi:hypothetical protein